MSIIPSEIAAGLERIRHNLENPQRQIPVTVPTPHQEIMKEISREVDSWCASPEGQAVLAATDGSNLEPLKKELDALLQGPDLARTRELLQQEKLFSGGRLGFIPKAVSIGISAQIDLVLGVYGSVGYAADFSDPEGTSVIYLLGAVEEGVIEGGDVGVQVGLWKNSTSDMDGYYNGQNVDITDFGGVAVFALEKSQSVVAYIIDIAAGEDDGGAEDEYYCLTFDINHMPVAQKDADHFLILTNLQCKNISETGHDEIYFYFQPDGGTTYRYPTWNYYAMSDSSSDSDSNWACGRSVKFNNNVTIKIMDDDDGSDDQIANFTFSLSDFNGNGSTITKTFDETHHLNEVEYKMTAKLIY